MILGVKGLTLSTQKCKWTPAKDRERNRDRKLGKVKGGGWGGEGHMLEWHLISGGRGVAVLPVTSHY